ncbi:MAG: hypothetical protein LBU64_07100 [Planctomycetota bacterium]|jgi:hypothetical protein|nr:hypothetical protein [Planctomycetota bacterium]
MKEIDPVEELHKIRGAICKEAGGTPAAYAQYYYEMSQKRLAADKAAQKVKEGPAKSKTKAVANKTGKRQRKVVVSG